MIVCLIVFLAALIVKLLVVRCEYLHAHINADHDLDEVQKFLTMPLQLLSYHVVPTKGMDLYKPRTLAKSVTSE